MMTTLRPRVPWKASTRSPKSQFNGLVISLTSPEKFWLGGLPLISEVRGFTIVHASLEDPGGWGYVLNQLDAAASFSRQTTELCFFGHTHTPRAYIKDSSVVGVPFEQLILEPEKEVLSSTLAAWASQEMETGEPLTSCSTKKSARSACAGCGMIWQKLRGKF